MVHLLQLNCYFKVLILVLIPGDMWQFHRAMIRPFFAKDKEVQYTIFEKTADKALSLLLERNKRGLSTDIQDLFTRYSFDGTVEFLFSMKFDTLDQKLPNPHYLSRSDSAHGDETSDLKHSRSTDFSHAFEIVQSVVASRVQLGSLWPLREIFSNWTTEPMRIIDSVLYEYIDAHLKPAEELEDLEEDDLSLLDRLSLKIDGDFSQLFL